MKEKNIYIYLRFYSLLLGSQQRYPCSSDFEAQLFLALAVSFTSQSLQLPWAGLVAQATGWSAWAFTGAGRSARGPETSLVRQSS